MKTYREVRNNGLTRLGIAMEAVWGPRCNFSEASCPTCAAWALLDVLDRFTESAFLDEPVSEDDKGRLE